MVLFLILFVEEVSTNVKGGSVNMAGLYPILKISVEAVDNTPELLKYVAEDALLNVPSVVTVGVIICIIFL